MILKKLSPILLFLVLSTFNYSFAQDLINSSPDSTVSDTTEDLNEYLKFIDEVEKSDEGFINLFFKDDKLYLEIPDEVLNKEMLLASTISEISNNRFGTVGAKPHYPLRIKFSKEGGSVLLHKLNLDDVAPEGNDNIEQALQKNNLGPVMQKFNVEFQNEDSTASVIDVTAFFNSDQDELSPFNGIGSTMPYGYTHDETFKADRSFVGDFKSFDDNLMIKSHLSYDYTLRLQDRVVEKEQPFTAVMTRTLLMLPKEPYKPRVADPRIGIFASGRMHYSDDADKAEALYYAHRFKLEPKNETAYLNNVLTEPVEPIVFYIDSDFPESWKPTIRQSVEDWNDTFEEIGFENAVLALDYPEDDPEFDPDNLKFNTIRYSPVPVQNAMGPSWVDPRSGEILNAAVYVYHDIVRLLNNWRFIQTAPADSEVRSPNLPNDILMADLAYVIRHEIGHTLGFMHNMAGASSIPVDSLRSPTFTQEYGTTHSIMDYARNNYVAQPGDKERGVKLTPPKFGVYDYYVTDWNYRYFPSEMSKDEISDEQKDFVSEKIKDVRYRYGKQQGFVMDPTSQTEALGDDPVKASDYGIQNLKYIMDNLNEWVKEEDSEFKYRLDIWNGIINQYVRYVNHTYAVIGGIKLHEVFEGDPYPNYEVVDAVKQEEAADYLFDMVRDLGWLEEESVVRNLPLSGSISNLLREELTNAILSIPEKVNLSAINSRSEQVYSSVDALEQIHNEIWFKTVNQQPLNSTDKYLQRRYLNSTITKSGVSIAGDANSLTDQSGYQFVEVPEFVEQYWKSELSSAVYHKYIEPNNENFSQFDEEELSASFGSRTVHFNLSPSLESEHYRYLLRTQSILERAVEEAYDTATKSHYQLLLHTLNNNLK